MSNFTEESAVIHSPLLTTNRLVLRAMSTADIDAFIEMRSDPETMQFIPSPLIKDAHSAICWMKEVAEQTKQGTCLHWAITSRINSAFMGTCGLFHWQPLHRRAETGYMIKKEFRKSGIATEAMQSLLDYGFQALDLHSIHASVMCRNEASLLLLRKLGFQLEVVRREATFWQDNWCTEYDFSILNNEWK